MEINLENAIQRARAEKKEKDALNRKPHRKAGSAPSWQAPVYSQSRRERIDLSVAEANHCVCALPERPENDFYRVLRTQVQHIALERGWRTIMLTSTVPGEGKTVTAINLAFAFAKAYHQTVLLVDCDFRRQNVKKYLGLRSDIGLIESLLGKAPLQDTIVWPGVEKLALISGSRTIMESSELLSSPMMKTAVMEMRERYDDRYLFFDAPPLLSGADAMAFAPAVDGILLVVGADGPSKEEVRSAMQMIPSDKLLGVVLNKHQGKLPNYYAYP